MHIHRTQLFLPMTMLIMVKMTVIMKENTDYSCTNRNSVSPELRLCASVLPSHVGMDESHVNMVNTFKVKTIATIRLLKYIFLELFVID